MLTQAGLRRLPDAGPDLSTRRLSVLSLELPDAHSTRRLSVLSLELPDAHQVSILVA